MVYVILRSGKVIQYNEANTIRVEDNTIVVCQSLKDADDIFLVAKFPLDVVERAEFKKPCVILKEKSLKNIKKVY